MQDSIGREKAQVAKEHSLLEELNQMLQKSMAEKESKIKEQKTEIVRTKHKLDMARKQNEALRIKNRMLFEANESLRSKNGMLLQACFHI